jgi:hypothetical protein
VKAQIVHIDLQRELMHIEKGKAIPVTGREGP